MNKDNKQIRNLVIIIVAIIGAILIFSRSRNDVSFCRNLFYDLAKGRQYTHKYIDWYNLQALGKSEVAETYLKLKDKEEQAKYKKAFIKNFALGFAQSQGNLKEFINWRIYSSDKSSSIIAANYRGHAILFTISKTPAGRKLSAVNWEEAK